MFDYRNERIGERSINLKTKGWCELSRTSIDNEYSKVTKIILQTKRNYARKPNRERKARLKRTKPMRLTK